MQPSLTPLGAHLRAARLSAALSLAEVAHRTGLSRDTVAAYERGYREPTVGTLLRLASLYGIRWTELIALCG